MTKRIRMPLDLDIAINPESDTVSMSIYDIPFEHLEGLLMNMAEPAWKQNILDAVNGAKVAKGMGIESTERSFMVFSEED